MVFSRGIPQPAIRVLASIGITRLEQLAAVSEDELMKLHGMEPRALAERGLSFAVKSN